MKEVNYIVRKYLLNHEKNKKYLALLLALCLLVSFAVPYSLIQPADSMTIQNSPLATQLSTASDEWFSTVQTVKPSDAAYNFGEKITDVSVTTKDGNAVTENEDGSVTIAGGSAAGVNVELTIKYTADANAVSKTQPYMYYQLPEGVTVPSAYYGANRKVTDGGKFSQLYPELGGVCGYYSISEDGLIVIKFTETYLEYLATQGEGSGFIRFDGYIAAAETAEADRTVTIGNATITVEFDDATYNIYKDAVSVANNGDGTATVTWQVRVATYRTSGNTTLSNVKVTDARFPSGGTGVTISPDNAKGSWNGTTFTFDNDMQNQPSEATFTFSETVTEEQLNALYSGTKKLSNTASYDYTTRDGTNYNGSKTADASFLDTTVTKIGQPDYMTGSMDNKVNWTITLNNPYGANLSSYKISDQMLKEAVSGTIVVLDGSGNAVSYDATDIENGNIVLGTTDASKVVIKYQTEAEIDKTYNNTVSVKYPNSDNALEDYPETVTYSNPYELSKVAAGFDPESKKAYWEVTVKTKADTLTLNGLTVTDDALSSFTMNDIEVVSVRSGSNSSLTAEVTDTTMTFGEYGILRKEGSTITIADGTAGGLNEIKLRYSTTVSDTQIANQDTVENDIKDSSGNELTAKNELTTPYSLYKTGYFDAATQTVTWTITVKNSASSTATLNGMVLTDVAFENLFNKNFDLVYAYQPSNTDISGTVSDNTVTFGNGSTMTLSKVDATDTTEESYILTFANAADGSGVNEVKFTYQTKVSDADVTAGTMQTNEVTANKPVTGDGSAEVQVNNPFYLNKTGTFDASTGEVTWTVTVKNTASGAASLGGVVLTDPAFKNIDATKINITTSNYNNGTASYTVSGNTITFTDGGTATFGGNETDGYTLTFSEDAKVGELVFQYTTTVSSTDFEKQTTQTNTIQDNKGHTINATAPVTNPYTLEKTGQFNPATGTITWTVTVSGVKDQNTPFGLLDGVVLTDNDEQHGFGNLVGGITIVSAEYWSDWWNKDQVVEISNENNVITVGKDNVSVNDNGNWHYADVPYATLTLVPNNGTLTIANADHNYSNYSNRGIHKVVFTYETAVDSTDIIGEVAQTNYIYDNKGHTVKRPVTPTNPFILNKTGQYDGEHEGVYWTIQSKNEGTGTIAGIVLKDSAFADLTIADFTVVSAGVDSNYTFTAALNEDKTAIVITINGATAGTLTMETDEEGNNNLVISDDATLDDVKIQFYKALTDAENKAGYASNSVTDNKGKTASDTVEKTNPYTLNKGGSYDADEGLITWNISAGITSSISTASLDKTVLTDDMLKRLTSADSINVTTATYNGTKLSVLKVEEITEESIEEGTEESVVTKKYVISLGTNNTTYATMTFDFTAGTVTFADATEDGLTGLSYVYFTYQTTPTDAEREAGKAINNVNSSQGNSAKAEPTIQTRSRLNKYFDNTNKNETVYGTDDADTRELSWHLELIEDTGFADKEFLVDTLTQSVAGTHYITQDELPISITAGKLEADNYSTTLTAGTDYTITFYDASGKAITEWTETTQAVKFAIDFNESVDTAGLRYVKVAYTTIADVSQITVDENAIDNVSASFGNSVTFGSNSDSDEGFYFERYPADYVEKVSITVNKIWYDNSGDDQSGIQVQLYQKLDDGESDWEAYGESVTLSTANSWSYTWENLPKTETTRTTQYLYRVEEFSVTDYTTSYSDNNTNGINSGTISVTNTPLPKCDKVYVSSTGSLASGSEILLQDLQKVTIDGTEYYIMQWKITPSSTNQVVTDTLPTGFTLLEDNNYGPFASWGSEMSMVGWNGSCRYEVTDTSTVKFYFSDAHYIRYYTKIPVADLKKQLEDGSGSANIINKVQAEGGNENPVTIKVSETTTSTDEEEKDLLTKDTIDSSIPGRLVYSVLVNPDGKNLANGDTIEINDAFNLLSYTGLSDAQVAALNANLFSIMVQEVAVAEDMSYTRLRTLSASEYQYTVDYKKQDVITSSYKFTETNLANKSGYVSARSSTGYSAGEEVTFVINASSNGSYITVNWVKSTGEMLSEHKITENGATYNATTGQWTVKMTVPENVTGVTVYDWYGGDITAVTATSTRTETTTADLNISVPDEKALLIIYQYDITGVTFTDNDAIGADNTVSFDTGNASASDSADKDQFIVEDSDAGYEASSNPVIKKTSTNDYSLTLDDARFKLAYYTANGWVFATSITSVTESGQTVITPVWDADATNNISTDNSIPENAYEFEIGTITMKLEHGKLYKIIETDVPEAYEGSNLLTDFNTLLAEYKAGTQTQYDDYLASFVATYPDTTSATFEQLLQMHLKGATGGPYDNFFKTFQSTFYFVYGSGEYLAPDGFDEPLLNVATGGTLALTNSILMDIAANKVWDATVSEELQADAEVTLKLYWSTVRKSTGFPSALNEAKASDLGLIGAFESEKTIGYGETAKWEDLPAGINGKPIYYYVKETAYTIGGVTYTLNETTGEYVAEDGTTKGPYKPIYVGNGSSGGNSKVTITNTKGLSIEKVWKNSDNTIMDADDIPLPEVPVNLYGQTSTGAETLIGTFTLKASENWILTVDDTLYNLTPYSSFRVEEALEVGQLYGYAISYTYNTSGAAGTITVTNKDNTPTEVDVAVSKTWADGSAAHAEDEITIHLWRTTSHQDDNGVSLTESNADLVETITLNASNSWTKTWEDLPYKSDDNDRYYYYPVEVVPDGYAANYNRIETAAKQEATITNYIPGTLNIQKLWQNSSGTAINGSSALLPSSIELEIYRKTYTYVAASDKVPEGIQVLAVGDSITAGTFNSLQGANQVEGDGFTGKNAYPSVLYYTYLASKTGADVDQNGQDGRKIDEINAALVYSETSKDYNAICILAGTNDIINSSVAITSTDENAVTLKTKLEALISDAYTANSNAVLYVATIPRFMALSWSNSRSIPQVSDYETDEATREASQKQWDTLVTDYNNMVKSVVSTAQAEGKKIQLVDVYTAVGNELYDGCHPTVQGYANIAKAFYEAINANYGGVNASEESTEHEPIDGLPSDLSTYTLYKTVSITPDKDGNWTLNLEVEDKDEKGNEYIYYVKEKTTGYEETYQNNGQILSDSSETITITNTIDVEKTSITVQKVWLDGNSSSRPTNITLTLQRSIDGETWESVNAAISWDSLGTTAWTGTYSNLEMCDTDGKYFIYKVVETVPDGYTVTYSNPDGVLLSAEATAEDRTLTVTNMKVFSLKISKLWADGGNHSGETVTIRIHRATQERTDGSSLMLALSTNTLNVQTGSTGTVTANNANITAESGEETVATVTVSGNTITIHGVAEGTATITVTNGAETETITVTVSDAPVLELAGEKTTMTAGETQQLTASMSDDSAIPGTITYSSSNTAAATVDANGVVTALNAGETTITATNGDGLTATYTITVSLSDSFSLGTNRTITVGDTVTITPDPIYGTFTYEQISGDGEVTLTTNADGSVTATGVTAGTAVVTAKRNDGKEATVQIMVEEIPLTVSPTTVTVTENTTTTLTANKTLTEDMVTVNNANVEIVSVDDKTITIKGVTVGSATVTVDDGVTTPQTVNVTVQSAYNGDVTGTDVTLSTKGAKKEISVSKSEEIAKIKVVLDTSTSSGFTLHTYVGNWEAQVDVVCSASGVLTVNENATIKNVESVEINGNTVIINLKDGVYAGTGLVTFYSNDGAINIESYAIYYESSLDEQPTETTTTTTQETTTTTTTTTTTATTAGGDSQETTTEETTVTESVEWITLSSLTETITIPSGVTQIEFEVASANTWKEYYFHAAGTDVTDPNVKMGFYDKKGDMSGDILEIEDGSTYYAGGESYTKNDFTFAVGSTSTSSPYTATFTVTYNGTGTWSSFYFTGVTITSIKYKFASPQAQVLSLRSMSASASQLSRATMVTSDEIEFVNDVATITLMASDGWEKIISNLPVCDEDGSVYYYWIEEAAMTGFTPTYKFEDGDTITADQDYCINAANPGDATATVKNTQTESSDTTMPSTGGRGTTWNYGIGMVMILGSAAGYLMFRRRQKDESK